MPTQIKKYLTAGKSFKSRVLLACKKATAVSCIVGIVMITNTSFASAYEAHTVNVTARIVNNIPGINPPGGEFCTAGEFKVELNVSLASADIYYTVDGTDPACGINKYSAPFELLNNAITTVKAVACHDIMRNGEMVLIQSAVMEKVFDVSEPSVNVIDPKDGDVWYCNPSNPIIYPVEWAVENYRGAASELNIDIIYIIDDGKIENGGVIGEIDNEDTRFYDLPGAIGLTGEDTNYQFELTQEYCYYGYGWMKVIATEPNNCSGFGISGRIFDPMAPDSSCGVSASNDNDDVPAAVSLDSTDADIEPEPAIDGENSENENIDDIVVDVDNTGNEDAESEESTDENTNDVDMNNENDDEADEDIRNEDTDNNADDLDDEEDSIDNDENDTLEDDGIIIDREEDFDEENNTDDDNADENVNDGDEDIDDDSIADSDISPGDDTSNDVDDEGTSESTSEGTSNDNSDNDDDSDDNDSPDDAPTIEEDDGSTEIEFSF